MHILFVEVIYFLDMVDFIVFPFLIAGNFPVRLFQQKVQRTDFFTFAQMCFIDVDLCAQNPW